MLYVTSIWSQTNERINVKGIILSNNNDIEGVTVFNASSNKGTITNDKGEFVIEVALNDRIEVSALQYESVTITIDEPVIKSKKLNIYLRDHINNLDAVLLTYGLSGNLLVDIKNIKPPPSINIDFGNMNAYQFKVDKALDNKVIADALNSVVNKGQLYNGVDFNKISKLIFKSKKTGTSKNEISQEQKPKELTDLYSQKGISKNFNIPLDSIGSFIHFLEVKGIPQELLKDENEMQRIEFLMEQSKLFLKKE